MNIFATLRVVWTFRKVTYYSVVLYSEDDDPATVPCLLEEFISQKQGDNQENLDSYDVVNEWIRNIGERGAKIDYFRNEGNRGGDAKALPPQFIKKNKLRLYCMRVNDNAVILFGGGVKTRRKAQDCDVVSVHFHRANKLVRLIDSAIKSREITINPSTGRLEYDPKLELQL